MSSVLIETAYDDISGIHLQYAVMCTEDPCIDDPALNKVYSLVMIKTEGPEDRESLFLYDISRCADRAMEIARIMKENTVTPCTAMEILDDIL